MFRRRIEARANCAPFVSQAILKTVKELYSLDHEDLQQQLDVGQIKLLVVAAEEPPGKPLEQCQKVPVMLTFDAGREDLDPAGSGSSSPAGPGPNGDNRPRPAVGRVGPPGLRLRFPTNASSSSP